MMLLEEICSLNENFLRKDEAINMQQNPITNAPEPVNDGDVSNKSYTDKKLSYTNNVNWLINPLIYP